MNYAPGYVKVWRSLLDWEWYHDDRCVRLLLHLCLKSNYTDRRWRGQELKPGQLITSAQSLADQLKWSRSAVNRTLDKLKACGEVDTEADNRWTLVTLVKWGQLQGDEENPDSKRSRNRTTTGQQTGQRPDSKPDTAKEGKKGRREEGVPNGTPVVELFEGSTIDPNKKSVMRESAVGSWDLFKSVPAMREAEAVGVDVQHYFQAILRWSDVNTAKKRTAQGWLSTVEGSMARDKAAGKLVLSGAVPRTQAKRDALIEYHRIGNEYEHDT